MFTVLTSSNESLQVLVGLPEYQSHSSHVFPSMESLRWYIRRHKQELIESGALLLIAGRQLVHRARFDECVLGIGTQTAIARLYDSEKKNGERPE